MSQLGHQVVIQFSKIFEMFRILKPHQVENGQEQELAAGLSFSIKSITIAINYTVNIFK